MRVGIDAEHAPKAQGRLMPPPVEVETPRVGVNFHGDAVFRTGPKNFLDVDLIAWPAQELATRYVSQDRGVWIGDGG